MNETTTVAPVATLCRENEPLSVVVTPMVVPFTMTLAPGIGCPEASVTRPETDTTDCEVCAATGLTAKNDIKSSIAPTSVRNSRWF